MIKYNIENHIKKVCKKNLIFPGVIILVTAVFLIFTPFMKMIFPITLSSPSNAQSLYQDGTRYVNYDFDDEFYFIGEYVSDEEIVGYYYFTFSDKKASFLILSDENLKNRPETLNGYSGVAKLTKIDSIDEKMFSDYAETLGWTPEALKESSYSIFINELEFDHSLYIYLALAILVLLLISLYMLIINLVYINFPILHPACGKLKKFGSKQVQLKALDYELENGIVMIVNKIVITKSYLVEFANNGIVMVPLVKITRVYEHTKWHKILWIKTKLSYTLDVIITKFYTISLKGNDKEAVEKILEYLQMNYLDTKVGYTDNNKTN